MSEKFKELIEKGLKDIKNVFCVGEIMENSIGEQLKSEGFAETAEIAILENKSIYDKRIKIGDNFFDFKTWKKGLEVLNLLSGNKKDYFDVIYVKKDMPCIVISGDYYVLVAPIIEESR